MHEAHRRRSCLLTSCLLLLAVAGAARGQGDKALERSDLDGRVYNVLRDIINTGADLYNPPLNDRAGCYRLYQGALLTVRPLLDHHPELQKAIDAGLTEAAQAESPGARAFALRRVLDRIRTEVHPEGIRPPSVALWDRLGGEKGVTKVIDDFVERAAKNPKANFTRDGKFKPDAAAVAAIKKRLVELVSSATGGPFKYGGKDMKEVHKGMNITDAEFDALTADLQTVLRDSSVKPEDAGELMKIVESTRKHIVEGKKPDEKKP